MALKVHFGLRGAYWKSTLPSVALNVCIALSALNVYIALSSSTLPFRVAASLYCTLCVKLHGMSGNESETVWDEWNWVWNCMRWVELNLKLSERSGFESETVWHERNWIWFCIMMVGIENHTVRVYINVGMGIESESVWYCWN